MSETHEKKECACCGITLPESSAINYCDPCNTDTCNCDAPVTDWWGVGESKEWRAKEAADECYRRLDLV